MYRGFLYMVQETESRHILDPSRGMRSLEPLEEALSTAVRAYSAANPNSARRYAEAGKVMPGGNTRSVLFYAPFPLCIVRGEGGRLLDADGHGYIDFLGEFTAASSAIPDPLIKAAIQAALDGGINLPAHNALEGELAARHLRAFSVDGTLRFTNSGTEANLMALAAGKRHHRAEARSWCSRAAITAACCRFRRRRDAGERAASIS